MPVEVNDKGDVSGQKAPETKMPSPAEAASVEYGTNTTQAVRALDRPATRRRKLLLVVLGVAALIAVCLLGIPWIRQALTTVSTDDAYVNSHVTFAAPRVGGQILRVVVDDNYRVRKGDLLVKIDKEPFEIAVSQKKAAVDTANADLKAAIASVRGIEAQTRSRRWKLQSAVQDLENQVALLHDRVCSR